MKKSSKGKGDTPALMTTADPNTLTSFFEVEIATRNGSPNEIEIDRALNLYVRSYNDLKGGFNDALERTMVSAQLESMTHARQRKLDKGDSRELQNLNVLLFLRVSGTCRGCQSNPFFTNQVVGRRSRRQLFDNPISNNSMTTGVPTEAETLWAYSLRLQAENLGSILNAISLNEMASLPTMGKGKGTKKSSSVKGKGSTVTAITPTMSGKGTKKSSGKGKGSTTIATGNTLLPFSN